MNLHILAASDRNNYGDLLFPLVVTKIVNSNNYKFDKIFNYGIIESDLTDFGALKTLSFDKLKSNYQEGDYIIIAGGEVLGNTWFNIYRYLDRRVSYINKNRVLRRLVLSFQGLIEKRFYNKCGSTYPFILDGFKNVNIVYNTIGGATVVNQMKKYSRVSQYFHNVKYLSVRDINTYSAFNDNSIETNLCPDSALIMADLFGDGLEVKISKDVLAYRNKKYVFLQFANKKGPDDLSDFLGKIKKFTIEKGLEVVLCPIGIALDHDDSEILEKIKSLEPDFHYVFPRNLYEIMYLIKASKMYIGSSLHGVVTAQSFNVPYFAFTEKIPKLDIYIKTWNQENSHLKTVKFSDWNNIYKAYESYDFEKERSKIAREKELVYKNFDQMFLS